MIFDNFLNIVLKNPIIKVKLYIYIKKQVYSTETHFMPDL